MYTHIISIKLEVSVRSWSIFRKAISNISAVLLIIMLSNVAMSDDNSLFNGLLHLAEQGNPEAQYHLGMAYNSGIGTKVDKTRAFEWFKKSASLGDALGQYKLGCYYAGQGGEGIPLDLEIALKYKLISAEAGYALAQGDVAKIFYQRGQIEEALLWWDRAARQGSSEALNILFGVHYQGTSVPKDLAKAYGYLSIIADNTEGKSIDKVNNMLKEIKAQLSPDQYKKALTISILWTVKPTTLTVKANSGKQEASRLVSLE
jgi:TPR repeat protein